jgi:hypothetical protein
MVGVCQQTWLVMTRRLIWPWCGLAHRIFSQRNSVIRRSFTSHQLFTGGHAGYGKVTHKIIFGEPPPGG